MKEIIERAEKLGYKRWFKFWHITELSEDQFYIELCLIQKWMREKFGIFISIFPSKNSFRLQISTYKYRPSIDDSIVTIQPSIKNIYHHNPEQALEEGIKKALEIL